MKKRRTPSYAGPVDGGWSVNGGDWSPEANPAAVDALNRAGYAYEPLAVLGSQVVAGMNYRILCRGALADPDAVAVYEIVTVYADLDGGAEITDSFALTERPGKDGGWSVNDADVQAAFEKASEGLTGAVYEPIAYMGAQVVAGMNCRVFCRVTPAVPDAVPAFATVTIYAGLDGGAEITDVNFVAL